jgi:hypothetical protein
MRLALLKRPGIVKNVVVSFNLVEPVIGNLEEVRISVEYMAGNLKYARLSGKYERQSCRSQAL